MGRSSVAARVLFVVIGAMALLVLGAAPGNAHSRLVSTNPADGDVLTASPATVSFTFDEPLLDGMNTISINDANGNMVTSSPVTPDGTVITLPIASPLVDGTYQAAYRVVSADGHAVMGAISFTVAAGSATASPITSTSTAATAPGSPSTPTSTSASASASASAAAGEPASPGTPWVLWLVVAIVAIAVIAGIVAAVRRGR